MKAVLLVLSGDPVRARESLRRALSAEAEIENLSRAEVEGSSYAERLSRLRALRPDVFAVSTERLAWQRGQNALLLFGALSGARRIILMDTDGALREETRARVFARAPQRMAGEAAVSAVAIARSWQTLRKLERAVGREERKGTAAHEKRYQKICPEHPCLTYLRATPGAGNQPGGASSHINGFIGAALKQGALVRLISNDPIAGLDESQTEVHIIDPVPVGATRAAFDLYNNLHFTRGAVAEIAREPPDFIYQRYSRFTWAGIEASLMTNRPLFLEYNGSEVWVGRHWDSAGMFPLLERVERLNLTAAARIFVVSEIERDNLLQAGVADEKIIVNPNGVDADAFRPGVGGVEVRQAFGVARSDTLVGFIGTFGPWHGVVELARAIALMPVDAPVKFLLVGTGKLREEVERIIREAHATARVIFAGTVEHKRVPAMLDACDVLVSPHVPLAGDTPFFGSPTKLFEYMAAGKGIVASRLGQIGDVLTDEETALLVEPGDVDELQRAILRMASEPGLRERLGQRARAQAVARHTWTHNAARVLRAYGALLE
jgi:glycosyltransferase involved in cell wall biosynthesis